MSIFLLSSFIFSCDKNKSDTIKQAIKTQNEILNGFGIKEYSFNQFNDSTSFTISFSSENIIAAEIIFKADLETFRQSHIYKDKDDYFEITFNNNDGILYLVDKRAGFNYEIYYDAEDETFKDRVSGENIKGNDWITKSKINKVKYTILSVVLDEVLNEKKLFIDPIKRLQAKEVEATLQNARNQNIEAINNPQIMSGTTEEPASCSYPQNCTSQVHYQMDRTRCCAEANTTLEICCNSAYPGDCIGCCSKNDCNWGGVLGDFMGICTKSGTTCGKKKPPVVLPPPERGA